MPGAPDLTSGFFLFCFVFLRGDCGVRWMPGWWAVGVWPLYESESPAMLVGPVRSGIQRRVPECRGVFFREWCAMDGRLHLVAKERREQKSE